MSESSNPVRAALSPIEFHVLLALAREPLHGYAMIVETERSTEGRIRLEPGNLYRALRRMRQRGLVAETGRRPAPESGDERRRYYRITAHGRRLAAEETARMAALVRAARALDLDSSETAR